MAIKPEGGGGNALMARPLREELFFAASLMEDIKTKKNWLFFIVVTDSIHTKRYLCIFVLLRTFQTFS